MDFQNCVAFSGVRPPQYGPANSASTGDGGGSQQRSRAGGFSLTVHMDVPQAPDRRSDTAYNMVAAAVKSMCRLIPPSAGANPKLTPLKHLSVENDRVVSVRPLSLDNVRNAEVEISRNNTYAAACLVVRGIHL